MARKKSTKKYSFKGYDMEEIFQAINLEIGEFKPPLTGELKTFTSFEDEDKFREEELNRLWKWIYVADGGIREVQIADIFRRYFEKFLPMEKKYHYHYPMWVGLAKIKDTSTFLKYCRVLFWYMWN